MGSPLLIAIDYFDGSVQEVCSVGKSWGRGCGGESPCNHVVCLPFFQAVLGNSGNTTSVFLPAQEKAFFTSPLCAQCIRLDPAAAAEGCSGLYRAVLGLGHEPAAGTEVVLWEWDFVPIFLLPQAVPGWDDKILHSSPVDGGQLG